ncbi:hypothetical protein GX48_07927 [Paracoccidioides brasiliensis]|nr:hypothetical protein GX48_07927 [Paracoccidioides brasiliensis]
MTAADLFAFCQQMMATNENSRINENTLHLDGYESCDYVRWDQLPSLEGGESMWTRRSSAALTLLRRTNMNHLRTLTPYKAHWIDPYGRTTIGALEPDNAAAPWQKISFEYAVSLAEERMNVMKELSTLYVKDNDYPTNQRRFRYLVARHKELANNRDDFYHDLFLNGLRNHRRAFVKTRLDDFMRQAKDPIVNIDIDDLMKQLTNPTSKTKDSERTKTPQANTATNDGNHQPSASTSTKCEICKPAGHVKKTRWRLHPELASSRWREAN